MGYEGWVLQQIPFNIIPLPHMSIYFFLFFPLLTILLFLSLSSLSRSPDPLPRNAHTPGTAAAWHPIMWPARPHYSLFSHGVTSHSLVYRRGVALSQSARDVLVRWRICSFSFYKWIKVDSAALWYELFAAAMCLCGMGACLLAMG